MAISTKPDETDYRIELNLSGFAGIATYCKPWSRFFYSWCLANVRNLLFDTNVI